jgi:hypothetical protein
MYSRSFNTDEVLLDHQSGIPLPEQREILRRLDAAGAFNAGDGVPVPARKKGFLLPVIVNAAAVFVLVESILVMSWAYRKSDAAIRYGQINALQTTEGAIVRQLRKESAAQINEKERQIQNVRHSLATLESELKSLQSALADGDLRESERSKLQAQMDSGRQREGQFLEELARLQGERRAIVQSAREQEHAAFAVAMAPNAADANAVDANTADAALAQERLLFQIQLARERQRAEEHRGEAAGNAAALTQAEQKVYAAERDARNAELDAAAARQAGAQEKAAADAERRLAQENERVKTADLQEARRMIAGFQAERAQTEKALSERDISLAILGRQNTDLTQQVRELRGSNAAAGRDLEALALNLAAMKAQNERDGRTIASLRAQTEGLGTQLDGLRSTVESDDGALITLRSKNAALSRSLSEQQAALATERAALAAERARGEELEGTLAGINKIVENMGKEAADKDKEIAGLKSAGTGLQAGIAAREKEMAALKAQADSLRAAVNELGVKNKEFSQTLAARDSAIAEKNASIAALEKQSKNLTQQLSAIRTLAESSPSQSHAVGEL